MNLNKGIKITQSNANVNIKVLPLGRSKVTNGPPKVISTNSSANSKNDSINEFNKEHSKQLFIQIVRPTNSQHDILQFMDDSTSNYNFSENPFFLQQITNKKVVKNNGEPEFGKGSSFKKQQKNTRVQQDVPTSYVLTIGKAKTQRKFKTAPQEMNPKCQYFIFVRKNETTFEAHSIENWYKINPFTKLDINSIEESEREMMKKDDLADLSNKKIREKYKIEEKEQHKTEIIYGNESKDLSDSEMQEKDALDKRKKNGLFQRIRHGKGDVDKGESDHDDHQGDEVDYMSDSSCDEDILSEGEKEKIYAAVDVDQEIFLRDELQEMSDESDDEEEKKDEKSETNPISNEKSDDEDDDDNSDDDNSDDDMSDEEVIKPKPKNDGNNNFSAASLKRPFVNTSFTESDVKRRKFTNPKTDEIVEEMRKHLKRKPLSAKDLFKILFKKNLLENNEESKALFTDVLGRLKPKTEVNQNIKMFSL